MSGVPLIDELARLIERTYDIDSRTIPLGRFVVGDAGHRRLTHGREVRARVDHPGDGARVLLRREGERWAAALYLPDALVAHLERFDPRRELGSHNIDAFAALVEEVDHLVTFAERSAAGADVSLLELEWHAEVTKYLAACHFAGRLSGTPRLDGAARDFIERALFHGVTFAAGEGRYRDAQRLAWRFLAAWRALAPPARLAYLRRFHRASPGGKLARFAA